MNGVNGVSAGVSALTDAYLPKRTGAVQDNEEVMGFGTDSVEISDEAKNALSKSKEMKRSEFLMKYRGLDNEEISDFRDINKRFENSGQTAKDFLLSLEKNERRLVQRANGYDGDFSHKAVESFSEEGVANFFQEQGAAFDVDLNGDGNAEHGNIKGSIVPQGAPAEVKDAWDIFEKTASKEEIMHMVIDMYRLEAYEVNGEVRVRQNGIQEQGYADTVEGWESYLDTQYQKDLERYNGGASSEEKASLEKSMKAISKFKAALKQVQDC